MSFIAEAAKAVYATVTAALGALLVILQGDATIHDVTTRQWVSIALLALAAGYGVYSVPNRLPAGRNNGGP